MLFYGMRPGNAVENCNIKLVIRDFSFTFGIFNVMRCGMRCERC